MKIWNFFKYFDLSGTGVSFVKLKNLLIIFANFFIKPGEKIAYKINILFLLTFKSKHAKKYKYTSIFLFFLIY